MTLTLPLTIAGLIALGVLAQWVAWRLKLPAILLLLLLGLGLGPWLHLYNPDELLGELLFPVVSMSVAIILFEGSLTLKLDQIREHGQVVTRLITLGVFATVVIIGYATHLLFDMPLGIAFLFGAIVCVSGPTVVVPLLRTVRPRRSVANILRWEGILIDPIGALLAVILFQFVAATGPDAVSRAPRCATMESGLSMASVAAAIAKLVHHLRHDYACLGYPPPARALRKGGRRETTERKRGNNKPSVRRPYWAATRLSPEARSSRSAFKMGYEFLR